MTGEKVRRMRGRGHPRFVVVGQEYAYVVAPDGRRTVDLEKTVITVRYVDVRAGKERMSLQQFMSRVDPGYLEMPRSYPRVNAATESDPRHLAARMRIFDARHNHN